MSEASASPLRKALAWLGLALLLSGPLSCGSSTGRRGVQRSSPLGGATSEALVYDGSRAVVIGIDRYTQLPSLEGAVRDARAVGQELRDRGMEVTLVVDSDATKLRIAQLLGDELPRELAWNDRVIVYFAGHGITTGDGDTAMGYLMPVEGKRDSPRSTGISMSELQGWLAGYPAKHVMFVADACYSGLALSSRAVGLPLAVPGYLSRITSKRVRLALVAGGAGEEANEWSGKGLFTHFFLDGLRGAADANRDGLVTSDELSAYVKPNVARVAASELGVAQNPQLGRRGEGELVFFNARLPEALAARPSASLLPPVRRTRSGPGGPIPDLSDYEAMRDAARAVRNKRKEAKEAKAKYARARRSAWSWVRELAQTTELPADRRIAAVQRFLTDFDRDNPFIRYAAELLESLEAERLRASVPHESEPLPGEEPTWIRLPAGTYRMGPKPEPDPDVSAPELREVTLDAFELMATEVTAGMYLSCVEAGACSAADKGHRCTFRREDRARHPVNCVTWTQARDFCAHIGGRLPTEAEWEYAARSAGRDQLYPWGDLGGSCRLAVTARVLPLMPGDLGQRPGTSAGGSGYASGCGEGHTWPVCSRRPGHSAQGLCDLAGNVSEWTADAWQKTLPSGDFRNPRATAEKGKEPPRVLKGCSYQQAVSPAYRRAPRVVRTQEPFIGFRCARSLSPSPTLTPKPDSKEHDG